MCDQGRPEENDYGIRVYRSDTCDGYLQKADVGQPGYCLVIWRGRHVADVTQLSDTEAGLYWSDVMRVSRAVELHYTPAKLNLMTLGNELPHLHTHVVPRYVDDSEPGKPPRFMRATIEQRQLPADEVVRDAIKLRELMEGRIVE
jgi:diadenosine tetraphosphate (Ap4A) HIT family hydrolase